MSLTPKREAFVKAYIELGSPSEAYKASFNAENMSPASISVEASKLLANPKIALRLMELQAMAQERHNMTVDDLLAELEEARQAAYSGEKPQAAAMVAATMGKAKLLGLEAPAKFDHMSSDGSMSAMPTRIELVAPEFKKDDDA